MICHDICKGTRTTPLLLEGKSVQNINADTSNSVEVYTDVGTSGALHNAATVNDNTFLAELCINDKS